MTNCKNIILDTVEKSFGKVDVYLFGSRVDNTKRTAERNPPHS